MVVVNLLLRHVLLLIWLLNLLFMSILVFDFFDLLLLRLIAFLLFPLVRLLLFGRETDDLSACSWSLDLLTRLDLLVFVFFVLAIH